MKNQSDVIIIGGGIIGLAIAWRLSQKKLKITILERGLIGREASFAAAGMLLPYGESFENDDFFLLNQASSLLYPAFIRELENFTGLTADYIPTGVLYPVYKQTEEKKLVSQFMWQNKRGLVYDRMSKKDMLAHWPGVSSSFLGGFYVHNDHQVDNRKLTMALLSACKLFNVNIQEKQEVVGLLEEQTVVEGVKTKCGSFKAAWVINAAGSWAGKPSLCVPSLKVPIIPIRGQRVNLRISNTAHRSHLKNVVFSKGCYLVPRKDGTLILGSIEEDVGFDKTSTPEGVYRLLKMALQTYPGIKNYRMESVESGLRPAAPDRWPILGLTPIQGYILATGHFRKGILLTPITAQEISALILSGRTSDIIKPFGIDRFNIKRRGHAN